MGPAFTVVGCTLDIAGEGGFAGDRAPGSRAQHEKVAFGGSLWVSGDYRVRGYPDCFHRLFSQLGAKVVDIETSSFRITWTIPRGDLTAAVQTLHRTLVEERQEPTP